MARPPDQSVENPDKPTGSLLKSSVSEVEPENVVNVQKVNRLKYLNIWMGLVIFIAAIIECLSWVIPQDKNYLLFWYPVFQTSIILVLSTFFIMKSFRYKSCIYTKIATIGFGSIQTISLLSLLIPNARVSMMLSFAQPIIILSVIISLLILFSRYVTNYTIDN